MAETLTVPTYRTVLLPAAECGRLAEAGGPLATVDLSQLTAGAVVAVECEGRVVAYWPMLLCLHLEPLWIAPDHRGAIGVTRRLWAGMQRLLRERGVTVAFGVIEHDQDPAVVDMATRAGFQPVPGRLYWVRPGEEGS